jgi:trimethylamine monooxygenase
VTTRNTANETETRTFDFLVLAHGRTNTPLIPEIPGLDSFTGRTMHVKNFREIQPGEYSGQKVCLVGAFLSGYDFFETLYDQGELPQKLIISKRKHDLFAGIKDSDYLAKVESGQIVHKSTIDRIEGSTLYFADGTSEEVDLIVWATGYQLLFPFHD